MKILLFGEYNRSHYFLKQGLEHLGHQVVIAGRDDGFKKIHLDISVDIKFLKKKLPHYFRMAIYRLTKYNIADLEIYSHFNKKKHLFKGYDVVQLINEFPLKIDPRLEKKCLEFLFKNNKKTFLAACGDDSIYINYLLNCDLEYHLLNPLQNDKALEKNYIYSLRYLKSNCVKLHQFVFKNITKVIPQDFDYEMAYKNHPKATQLIPHPINVENLIFKPLDISHKIVIFHGINRFNYHKKGNYYFEKALEILKEKHADKIEIITAENLPYQEYIKAFDASHILLDQVYSYDQGYNALEAMAKGKVVFSGAETDWLKHFNVEENTILFNALPDAHKIANDLEQLVLNPKKLKEISKNGRAFVEQHHNHITIAKQFEKIYTS